MSAWRRVATILGWSAGVCAAVYLVWLAYLYVLTEISDPLDPGSSDADLPFTILFVILVASPVIGGLIGLVKAVRGAPTTEKVGWSFIGVVLIGGAWWALAGLAIWILVRLPQPA